MSARKISDLPPAATPLTGAELIPAVQTEASVRLAASDLVELTRATTPAFMAHLSTTAGDKTGDGTVYDVAFDKTVYDRGTNFDTTRGAFIAPVAGLYEFKGYLLLSGVDTTMNRFIFSIRTRISGADAKVITGEIGDLTPDVNGRASIATSAPPQLAANEEVYLRLAVYGSGRTVDVIGANVGPPFNFGSFFCGRLVG